MEVLLDKFKAGQYPNIKQNLEERKLKNGCVSYEWRTFTHKGFSDEEISKEIERNLGPIHRALIGNSDYEGKNILLTATPVLIKGAPPYDNVYYVHEIKFEILINRVNWKNLPEDLIIKHGRRTLTVTNITRK